jgi:ribosome modulation factor
MARKKGSKNKAKENGEAPGEGHNSKPLSDAERQALHFRHVTEYQRELAAKKKADAELKNTAKRILSEGGSVAAVKQTIELSTPEGETAFRARMAEMAEVAAWNGVGIQVDMFADEREPAEDRAFGEGRRAGMKGESNKPPYDPSVPQYAKWLDGYSEGNAVLFSEGFKRLVPTAETAAAH